MVDILMGVEDIDIQIKDITIMLDMMLEDMHYSNIMGILLAMGNLIVMGILAVRDATNSLIADILNIQLVIDKHLDVDITLDIIIEGMVDIMEDITKEARVKV